jgi:hypothetical protein
MRARFAAVGAAVWTGGYLAAYLLIMNGQDDSPAWWYVAVLVAAIVLLIPTALGRPSVPPLTVAVILLSGAALIGLLSIGVLLIPAVATAVFALTAGRRPYQPPDNPLPSW